MGGSPTSVNRPQSSAYCNGFLVKEPQQINSRSWSSRKEQLRPSEQCKGVQLDLCNGLAQSTGISAKAQHSKVCRHV